MPTQEEMDKATKDFLLYTDRAKTLAAAAADSQKQLDDLNAQKEALQADIEKLKDVQTPLREQLQQLERDIVDIQAKKAAEAKAEQTAFEANQKIIAGQTAQLASLHEELQKRGFALDDRQKAIETQTQAAEAQKAANLSASMTLTTQADRLTDRETSLVAKERELEEKNQELQKQLSEVQAQLVSATTAEERTHADRIVHESIAAKASNDLTDLAAQRGMLEQTKEEINTLLPVLKEFYDYVKTHVKDPDGIAHTLQQLFPLATNALNQGSL